MTVFERDDEWIVYLGSKLIMIRRIKRKNNNDIYYSQKKCGRDSSTQNKTKKTDINETKIDWKRRQTGVIIKLRE